MPDRRASRGPHPKDVACFAPAAVEVLRRAVAELSWLLSRGYPPDASIKLVGDRHALRDRQRKALQRAAASDADCRRRAARETAPAAMAGRSLVLDGYNVLLTVEAALSGGVLLLGRDGALRDLAAMSRHYRRVRETRAAIEAIGVVLAELGCAGATWYLDRPISNSGRLRSLIEVAAAERRWPWRVELAERTDATLLAAGEVIATADSGILDQCRGWLNLARLVVARQIPQARVLELGQPPAEVG